MMECSLSLTSSRAGGRSRGGGRAHSFFGFCYLSRRCNHHKFYLEIVHLAIESE